MRAIIQDRYGSPDDLRLAEVPTPVAGDDEVLVRVRAASVHADVWHVVTGRPRVLRLMGGGLRRPRNPIPGTDLAGTVEAVGRDVGTLAPGDRVYGETLTGMQWTNGGTFAEYAAVRASALARIPAALSFEEAAAIPTSAFIALQGIRDQGRVRPGQRVLINGAGGGVGIYAVQIAKALGAHVTAVDRPTKRAMLAELGADRFVDPAMEDFTATAEPYHLILDVASTRTLAECRRALTRDGRYVLIGHDHYGATGHRTIGSLGRFAGQVLVSPFDRHLRGSQFVAQDPDRLAYITGLVESGQLRGVVDRTYPLESVGAAIHRLTTEQTLGKIVLTI